MNKIEVQQRVLQNGKPLDLDKFSWDEATKTFSTIENNLILDFTGTECFTFITGNHCTFKTGWYCTFKTGHRCTFITGDYCTFTTGDSCIFTTGWYCTLKTGYNCTITTGIYCVCIRRDVFEFFEIPEKTKIQLNEYGVKGFKIL